MKGFLASVCNAPGVDIPTCVTVACSLFLASGLNAHGMLGGTVGGVCMLAVGTRTSRAGPFVSLSLSVTIAGVFTEPTRGWVAHAYEWFPTGPPTLLAIGFLYGLLWPPLINRLYRRTEDGNG